MDEIIAFLRDLSANNNRPWFQEHKARYLEVKARFDAFATDLIEAVRAFDPDIAPLTVADCTWRIYRDTRFSHDKTPYKTHMGVYIAPGGRRSGFSGYYFHIADGVDDHPLLAAGNYYCEPKVLRLLREDILLDEGCEFDIAAAAATGFSVDTSDALKRAAKGFPDDRPFSHWLRLRNFCLIKNVGTSYATAPRLVERLAADFARTRPFLTLVNRAIAYSRTEQ